LVKGEKGDDCHIITKKKYLNKMNMLALGHKGVNKLALICTLLYCIDTPLYYIEPYHSREAYATMNLSSQAKDTNGIHGVTALLSRSPELRWTRTIANTTRDTS